MLSSVYFSAIVVANYVCMPSLLHGAPLYTAQKTLEKAETGMLRVAKMPYVHQGTLSIANSLLHEIIIAT